MVTESSRNIKRNFIVYRFKRKVEFKRQDKANKASKGLYIHAGGKGKWCALAYNPF